jgi:hypothetical protein
MPPAICLVLVQLGKHANQCILSAEPQLMLFEWGRAHMHVFE